MMYKISFAQSESEYVGSTASTLHNKVTERGGRSFRTAAFLTYLLYSDIRVYNYYALSGNIPVHIDNYNILARSNSIIDVRYLESSFVYKT